MNRRGFTLIELIIAIVLVGLMSAFFFPKIGAELRKQGVRSARNAITTMHAKAKATAIQRGMPTSLVTRGNTIVLVAQHPVTRAVDTLDIQNLASSYGVTVFCSRDSLAFDARGLGGESSNTTIAISKSGFADTIVISSVGSVLR